MHKYKSHFISEHLLLSIILLLFFISNFIIIFYQKNIWWDAAVYAGMGKYIFSFGNAGLWEPVRPLVWPLMLGFLWKLNLDVVLFGKLLSLFFSLGVLLITFLIAKEIFDKKIALLAVFLLALTPTFFFFSTIMLSGIVSTFFVLLAIYFFIKKNYFLSGIFFGIGFMTRFLQLLAFAIVIILFFIYQKHNKDFVRNFVNLTIGFFIPIAPYLVLNYILYNNILHPFLLQLFLTKVTGWMYFEPFWFYFVELFKGNFLYLFFIPGIIYLFKNKLSIEKSIILSLSLTLFLFFVFVMHKEMRFLLTLFPYLYILTSYGIIKFFEAINQKNIRVPLSYILIIFIFQASLSIYFDEKEELEKGNRFIDFQAYLDKESGKLWISNPAYAIYSNKKIDTLIYYPTFDKKKINFLNSNLPKADSILLDTCDILCNPKDLECFNKKDSFLFNIKNNFEIIYNNKYSNCEQFIFVKK